MAGNGRIEAVLGPTNTGKTHYAIDRMLAYRTGIIGLPLRLLAREVYDKIKALPDRAQYWVCTVEAMPQGMGVDFVAIDEIQLCADPDRGHVFTDRLLHARGHHETLFLGSDTMRSAIAAQVPGVQFQHRGRMSELTYVGAKKLSRMPPRSAIVGFSVENVYAIAELLRRQKGGAAVVMGALSPRTRNAQVDLYQNGEVDYLVATDAIGMGLNLDIRHVAFSALSKFDGRRMRMLQPNELAQIAGRAGRYTDNGTFGVTGEARPLDDGTAEAIMENRFVPVRKLHWRNARLEFGTVGRLISSLETQTHDEWLTRARDADDVLALKTLAEIPAVRDRMRGGPDVQLLWDVCRIPDFRGISHAEHAGLLEAIFGFLHEYRRIPDDWMDRQVKRIDRTEGDIDTLSKRLAYIRTWTYVAQRKGWLDDESHWRDVTRAVEDRLSDALHARLTQRFVDRRTSVLLRRLKQKESLVADVNDKGEVTVEGQFVGRLEGFRFAQDQSASPDEARTLRQASLQSLAPHFHLRADRLYNAPDTELDYTEQGGLMWGDSAVGKLIAGADPLRPRVQGFVDDEAGPDVAQKVERRLQHFIDRKIASLFEPLLALRDDEALTGLARGFAFRMVEAHGILPRAGVAEEVKQLDQEARGALRKHGIRFGQFTVFLPLLLKPAPTRLRLVLWSLAAGLDEFPESPPPGLVTVPARAGMPDGYHTMSGYHAAGDRAIRIDMLERLADMLRGKDTRGGFEATADMLSITGMTLEQFAVLMQGLGYAAERAERPKQRPVDAKAAAKVDALAAESPKEILDGASVASPESGMDPDAKASSVVDAVASAATDGSDTVDAGQDPADAVSEESPAASVDAALLDDAPQEDAPQEDAPQEDAKAEPVASADVDPVASSAGDAALSDDAVVETEVFYTFRWQPPRRHGARPQGGRGRRDAQGEPQVDRQGDKLRGDRKPGGERKQGGDRKQDGERPKGGKPKGKRPQQDTAQAPRISAARPPRSEKAIDPDNPFAAALMGLRDKI